MVLAEDGLLLDRAEVGLLLRAEAAESGLSSEVEAREAAASSALGVLLLESASDPGLEPGTDLALSSPPAPASSSDCLLALSSSSVPLTWL